MRPETLSPTERVLLLKTIPGFDELEIHSLRQVVQVMGERYFRRGELLLEEGEPIRECLFVVQGTCEVLANGESICSPEAPSSVGFWAVLSGATESSTTVRAKRDLVALSIDARAVLRLWESNFDLLNQTLRFVARAVLMSREGFPFDPETPPNPAKREPQPVALDLVDKLEIQAETSWFQGANLDAVAEICRAQKELRRSAGEVLWKEGDDATASYRIVAGLVDVRRNGEHVGTLGMDYTFGLLDALGGDRRTYEAVAATDVVLLETDVTTLLEVNFDHFDLATRLYGAMRKLTRTNELVC